MHTICMLKEGTLRKICICEFTGMYTCICVWLCVHVCVCMMRVRLRVEHTLHVLYTVCESLLSWRVYMRIYASACVCMWSVCVSVKRMRIVVFVCEHPHAPTLIAHS